MVCYEALLSVWDRVVHGGSIVLVQSQDCSGYRWSLSTRMVCYEA